MFKIDKIRWPSLIKWIVKTSDFLKKNLTPNFYYKRKKEKNEDRKKVRKLSENCISCDKWLDL